jgi:hypothetical protein
MKGTGSARVSSAKRLSTVAPGLAGAVCQVEEPVALVTAATELRVAKESPCRRRRDRGANRGSPRSSPEADTSSFKDIVPDMNRLPRIHHASRWRSFGSDLTAAHHFSKGTRVSGRACISRCGAFVTPFQSNSAVFDTGRGPRFPVEPWGDQPSAIRSTRPFPGRRSQRALGGSRIPASGQRRRQWIPRDADDAAPSQSPPEAA